MRRPVSNVAASVHARLHPIARERGVEFNRVLERFVLERLLYRLSLSPHRDALLLKGAMLFVAWPAATDRTTRDLDFLGTTSREPRDVANLVRELCATAVPVDDGVAFDPASVTAEPIRSEARYGGVRARLVARLGQARVPVQVDVGFGDAVVPDPREIVYPVLLDFPAPRIRAYPPEAVVAEKLEALVALGTTNTRFKDFHDLWMIAGSLEFKGSLLAKAVAATFERRQSALEAEVPAGLTPAFYEDERRGGQWRAFLRRVGVVEAPSEFPAVGRVLGAFLLPVLDAARGGGAFDREWRDGGWR